MLKLRAMGTEQELEQFKEYLEEAQDAYEVESISELYPNKGTDRHLRMYAEIQNNRKKKEAEK